MISGVPTPFGSRKNAQHLALLYHFTHIRRQKIVAPAALELPDWLEANEYKDPVGIMPTAWCSAFHTDKHPNEYLAANPKAREIAHAHMLVQRDGRPICWDGLDFQKRFAPETTDSTILLVDIGGAVGAQSVAFRKHYSDLPGRVIL